MEINEISIAKIGLESPNPTLEDFESCGKSFFESFSKIGFAYIRDHGIESSLISEAFESSREFFSLPIEAKNRVRKIKGDDQGYVGRGQEIFDASQDSEKVAFYADSFSQT
jgi:isopenicillin N synthase-like dioxygenase